jgi:hypothetical protein
MGLRPTVLRGKDGTQGLQYHVVEMELRLTVLRGRDGTQVLQYHVVEMGLKALSTSR